MEYNRKMRYPSFPTGQGTTSTTTSSSIPTPSVSGLAFACLAASLPLLQSRDLYILSILQSISPLLLDLLVEPAHSADSAPRLHSIQDSNCQRLQHLIHRFEQVFYVHMFDLN
jgi:hypothetical protein